MHTSTPLKRYLVLPSFLTHHAQIDLKEEVLQCHFKSTDSFQAAHATASIRIHLGISCGASVDHTLPLASQYARRAFATARETFPCDDDAVLQLLATSSPLTGLALLYGPNAKMTPHFDSPTQPGQRHEWLVMFTVGKAVDFMCHNEIITLTSGDALVMDSMAVLHGVTAIRQDDCTVSLPVEGSRLGVLLWQARQATTSKCEPRNITADTDCMQGVNFLFQHDNSDDDDDDENDDDH